MIYKREEYVEEVNTPDAKFPVRRIEVLTPVDGGKPKFFGEVTLGIQTPLGIHQLPISFEIEAESIHKAFKKFDETARPRVEEARLEIEEELRRIQREQASRIIRPGEMGLPPGGLTGLRKQQP